MKKYYVYTLLVFFILIIPKNVKAAGLCDNRTMADYRELAGNIKIYTDYRIVENQAKFDITITNIPREVYILDVSTEKVYRAENFTTYNELIIKDYTENQRITFQIFMNMGGCYGEKLTTIYATLPNYNEYSSDPVCEGAEDFSLCQKWGTVSTGYNDFVTQINDYKLKKKQNTVVVYEPQEPNLKDKILDFIGDYYIYLIGFIAIIVLLLMALKTWASNKNEFDFKV